MSLYGQPELESKGWPVQGPHPIRYEVVAGGGSGTAVVDLRKLSAAQLNATLYNDCQYLNQSPTCAAYTGGSSTGSTAAAGGGGEVWRERGTPILVFERWLPSLTTSATA